MTLTLRQKISLEHKHNATYDGNLRDCIKAILLSSEGWSTAMISQALRISELAVVHHLKNYSRLESKSPSPTNQVIVKNSVLLTNEERDMIMSLFYQGNVE